ncbi:MAG: ABC transporter permease [Candidatus Lokiarchaeota archaeon]
MNLERVYALVKMELKKIIREPAYLFLMLLFPAALTVTFGFAFGSFPSATPGVSTFEFMAPGLFAYACIFIIMIVAQTFSDDRENGLLKRINITPTTSTEFMSSHILSNTALVLLQVVIVAILTFIMGFRPQTTFLGYIVAAVFMILLAICSVGFGLITATISKSSGTATGLSFIFILPQMFFGTFIPLTETTTLVAMFLPSYYATDSLGRIFNGVVLTDLNIWFNLMVLGLSSIAIVIVGILLFKKYGKA